MKKLSIGVPGTLDILALQSMLKPKRLLNLKLYPVPTKPATLQLHELPDAELYEYGDAIKNTPGDSVDFLLIWYGLVQNAVVDEENVYE